MAALTISCDRDNKCGTVSEAGGLWLQMGRTAGSGSRKLCPQRRGETSCSWKSGKEGRLLVKQQFDTDGSRSPTQP